MMAYQIHNGLGGPVGQQAAQIGTGTGIAITGAIAAPGAVSAAAIAVPIAGAVAAVGMLIYAWMSRRNAQKVAATHVVDEAEPFLRQNRDAFLDLPNPTATDKAAALQYFDAVWSQVVKECKAIGGGGGQRCVTDRQPGGQWDWFAYYRVPIEETEVTAPTITQQLGIPAGLFPSLNLPEGMGPLAAILGAGLIAWAVAS
jgi:hypothetical protein